MVLDARAAARGACGAKRDFGFTQSMSAPLARLFDLTGRVGLVTGGSRGLGLQAAEALGEYGATIALIARKEAELNEAVDHLSALGISAYAFMADLGCAGVAG